MNLLHKNLKSGVKGTLVALFIMSFIYGLSIRTGKEQPLVQHCLAVMTDHYYLIYFMIPLLLLLLFFVMEDDSELVILRYKTYFRYFVCKWASVAIILLLFLLTQSLAVALSAIGLPMGNAWAIGSGGTLYELFGLLSSIFSSPALCLAATLAFMLVGLVATGLVTMWLGHFFAKSQATKIMLLLYLLSIGSIRIDVVRKLPITAFNHIIILHHSFSSPYRLAVTVIEAVIVVALIFWTVKKRWNQPLMSRRRRAGLAAYYCKALINKKNIAILSAIIAGMTLWKFLQSVGAMDAQSWIIRLFSGHGVGQFHALSFVELLLLCYAPVYLLAIFLEQATKEHSIFITVRIKKRSNLVKGIVASALVFICVYGILLFVVPLAALTAASLPIGSHVLKILITAVALKMLDVCAGFLFIFAIYCVSGHTTTGFVALLGANLLGIVPVEFLKYLPFGLSSLLRTRLMAGGGLTVQLAAAILLVTNAVLICWLFKGGTKRLPKN